MLDRTVKVFNISDNDYQLCATLQGHEGPVWGLSWAHPKFGVLLASCSFDGSVFIYKEQTPGNWAIWHDARSLHESSVNAVAFCPHEFGLQLACASADGRVSMLVHQPNHTWSVEYLEDCSTGVNAYVALLLLLLMLVFSSLLVHRSIFFLSHTNTKTTFFYNATVSVGLRTAPTTTRRIPTLPKHPVLSRPAATIRFAFGSTTPKRTCGKIPVRKPVIPIGSETLRGLPVCCREKTWSRAAPKTRRF